jgi:hypothetical protein
MGAIEGIRNRGQEGLRLLLLGNSDLKKKSIKFSFDFATIFIIKALKTHKKVN